MIIHHPCMARALGLFLNPLSPRILVRGASQHYPLHLCRVRASIPPVHPTSRSRQFLPIHHSMVFHRLRRLQISSHSSILIHHHSSTSRHPLNNNSVHLLNSSLIRHRHSSLLYLHNSSSLRRRNNNSRHHHKIQHILHMSPHHHHFPGTEQFPRLPRRIPNHLHLMPRTCSYHRPLL